MKSQSSVSRRALLAASAVSAVTVANAADQKSSGDHTSKPTPLKLKVTLTDGQVLTLSAAEVLIDFGGNGQLLLRPEGKPNQGSEHPSEDHNQDKPRSR